MQNIPLMAKDNTKLPTYSRVSYPGRDKPYTVLRYITQERFDDALSYRAQPNDVFICAYPKSGVTWVLHALYTLRSGGTTMSPEQDIDVIFPFIEMDGKKKVEDVIERPRIVKTHLGPGMVPWHEEAKYVVIARNPKDVLTSFYYHTVGFKKAYDFVDGKFDDYFELAINGEVDSGDYFRFVPEWWHKSKQASNILFLLYEDILSDTPSEFLKIARFLGPELQQIAIQNNSKVLKKMVGGSSFKNMQEAVIKSRTRPPEIPFVRKGTIGDWKNLMNKCQSRRIDERLEDAGKTYPGFDRLWDKYRDCLVA